MRLHSAKTRHALLTAAASLAIAAAALGGAAAQETIKMGGIVSMTGGGASIGVVADQAWRLAIEEINANGGILGKQVEYVLADTATDPTHGVSEARRLIDSAGVHLLVGPATSQETIPITGVTTEKKIAQVSTAASTQLTPEFAPFHFSTSVTGINQMRPNIDFALNVLNVTKLALISDNGGMSKAAANEIVEYMQSKGVEPVIVQEFPFRTEDVTPQLFSMRNAGAEAILLINSIGDDSRKVIENLDDIGWDVPVLANQTMTNFAVGNAEILGEEVFANVYSTQFEGMTYCPDDEVGASAFARFAERAKASVTDLDRMGGAPALTPYYIQPIILAAAANGAGTTDGEELARWIEANGSQIEVVIGGVEASDSSHFLPALSSIKVVRNPHKLREDGLVERADCGS